MATSKRKMFLRVCVFLVAVFMVMMSAVSPVVALNKDEYNRYAQNSIYFYDPDTECIPREGGGGGGGDRYEGDEKWDGSSCTEVTSSREAWLNRTKGSSSRIIDNILSVAKSNSLPWELIPAQAFMESGGGKDDACDFNPLGLKVKAGHAGCANGFAKFGSYEEAFQYYVDSIKPIREVKGKYPDDPYSAIAYIQYGAENPYASCDNEADLKNPDSPCYGHKIGDPTPGYVKKVSSLICGIQKWAEENGIETSRVTYRNYSSGGSDGGDEKGGEEGSGDSDGTGVTWSGGWIDGDSFSGYTKEVPPSKWSDKSENRSFEVGPNKILLHSTEGVSQKDGDTGKYSGLAVYPSGNHHAPHFTIDPIRKELYQHYSIGVSSNAIRDYDDYGPIQIEIIGFSDGHEKSKYNLDNFTDDEWDYVALLLIAISEETGIPLTSSVNWASPTRLSVTEFKNYNGVLGHEHAPSPNDHADPGNIWSYVQAAIKRNPNSESVGGGGDGGSSDDDSDDSEGLPYCDEEDDDGEYEDPKAGDLASYVKAWAWPDYHKPPYGVRMPAYADYMDNESTYHPCDGVDCGAFVWNIIRASGWDPDYAPRSYNSSGQASYLRNNWDRVTDIDDLKLGDVGVRSGHVILYVGDIPGFNSKTASASDCRGPNRRAPTAGSPNEDLNNYTWYRKR